MADYFEGLNYYKNTADGLDTAARGGNTNQWANFGLTDQEYQDLMPYMDSVQKPVYAFGDLLTGKWSSKVQDYLQELRNRKTNAEELASARAYENTAIQRQVADMKKAGLNPYWASSSYSGEKSESSSRNTYKSSHSAKSANSLDLVSNILRLIGTLMEM